MLSEQPFAFDVTFFVLKLAHNTTAKMARQNCTIALIFKIEWENSTWIVTVNNKYPEKTLTSFLDLQDPLIGIILTTAQLVYNKCHVSTSNNAVNT
jgi:hypothetical protein